MKNRYEVRGEVTIIRLNEMKGIPLETLIDTADLPKVKQISGHWTASKHKHTNTFYVRGYDKGKRPALHYFLCGEPVGFVIDHINHDTLDNRRKINLRVATIAQNGQNRKGASKNSKSRIRNVYFDSIKDKWIVRMQANEKRIFVGAFLDQETAKKAAEEARRKIMYYEAPLPPYI